MKPRFVAAIHSNNLKSLKLQENHTGNIHKRMYGDPQGDLQFMLDRWWSTLEKLECLNSVIMGGGPGYNAVLQCIYRISSTVLAMSYDA